MNITSRSRYALKIMIDLATSTSAEPVRRQDMARRQGVPAKYLDQILVFLRKAQLVESIRGREGGYRLMRPPEEISVWDIFHAAEDGLYPVLCLDQDLHCLYESSCVTHDPWRQIFDAMKAPLANMSLKSMVETFGDDRKMCPIGGVRECQPARGGEKLLAKKEVP